MKNAPNLVVAGQVQQVLDLTQVSVGRSKCKGVFCRHGSLAVWPETWYGDGDTHTGTMLEMGTFTPRVKGARKIRSQGPNLGKFHKTKVVEQP